MISDKTIPIVFIHKGYSWYLNYSLAQAVAYNKKSPIYILGDEQTNRTSRTIFTNIEKYKSSAELLRKNYKHRSDNNPEIELFCFERWFYLRELMKEHGLKKIFTCDSDVMLYCNVTEEEMKFDLYDAAFCMANNQDNFRLNASAHVSYWTYDGINGFCSFLLKNYSDTASLQEIEEKWNYIVKQKMNGGISDMAFLHLFSRHSKILNLASVRNASVYDDNISSSENYFTDEYKMENGKKKILWKNHAPFGFNQISREEVKFNALHFQGPAKGLMIEFYKMNQGWWNARKIKLSMKVRKYFNKIKGIKA